jgi:hypothetical protein
MLGAVFRLGGDIMEPTFETAHAFVWIIGHFCPLNHAVFSYCMPPYKTSRPKRHTLPDWPAVQRGEDAGETIMKLWQDYAARVPLPYGV